MIKAPQYFQNQIYHFPLRASNRLCGMYNEWVWTTQSKQVSHVTSIVFKTAAILVDQQRWYTHQKKHVSRVWNPLRFYSELPAHVKREDNHCKSQIPSEASTSCRIQSGLHVLVVNYDENTSPNGFWGLCLLQIKCWSCEIKAFCFIILCWYLQEKGSSGLGLTILNSGNVYTNHTKPLSSFAAQFIRGAGFSLV